MSLLPKPGIVCIKNDSVDLCLTVYQWILKTSYKYRNFDLSFVSNICVLLVQITICPATCIVDSTLRRLMNGYRHFGRKVLGLRKS